MAEPPARYGIFTTHPQKYPRAMQQAAILATHMHTLVRRGPHTLVATVVDPSYQITQGYVLATTEQGIVRVYGVPYGSVCQNMRIYVRQQGGQATNRAYVYDGAAPALSSLSSTGSILYGTLDPSASPIVLATTTSSIPTTASLSSATGYYWHCFFYLAALPTSQAVLLAMWTGSTSSQILLALRPSGQLSFASSDGHGYLTNNIVAPHQVHWVQIQPGLSGAELLVDGIANYRGLLSMGDEPTFAGAGASYTLTLLTDGNGAGLCPLGSWVSKVGFGASYTGGSVVALSTGTTIPANDDQVPSFNVSSTKQTSALYLCNDTPGATSAANTAPSGSASALTLTAACTSISVLGPY